VASDSAAFRAFHLRVELPFSITSQAGLNSLLDANTTKAEFLKRVEDASGKPVIVTSDPKIAGHAVIKVATSDQPAHVLLYKPQHESVLPYLVAYQCSLALRIIQAAPENQFDLASKPNMQSEVLSLMENHAEGNPSISRDVVAQLASQFGHGLGWQLRSIPIAIRLDQQIHEEHPELREFQEKSIELQLQENMHALSPQAKQIAPEQIVRPNASMNSAFAKFWAGLLKSPMVFAPYVAAGYSPVASELLSLNATVPESSDHDRELVDAWANLLGLDRWFKTQSR